jgi:membrane protease YdiL (CAAX protease family)
VDAGIDRHGHLDRDQHSGRDLQEELVTPKPQATEQTKDAANPAAHGLLLVALLVLFAFALPSLVWPWYLLLPLLIYATLVAAIPPLRKSAPIPAVGQIGGRPLLAAVVLIAGTTTVLIAFQLLASPDATEFVARLPTAWFGHVVLAAVILSVVNAALEEIVFRAILWDAVAAEWNRGTALAVTSLLFGLAHLHGYPSGVVGAILAGLYGVALGVLRWWTGGLALGYACHVCADATIMGILIATGALIGVMT